MSNELLNAVTMSVPSAVKYAKYEKVVEQASKRAKHNIIDFSNLLYKEWEKEGKTEEALIGIYRAMMLKGLSDYELRKMTGKRLIDRGRNNGGYALIADNI